MKAYEAWDDKHVENYLTVVFAETAQKAKAIAMTTEACERAAYTYIRVKRPPEMDGHDRGRSEINWFHMADRQALVALARACLHTPGGCYTYPCQPDCRPWQEAEADHE